MIDKYAKEPVATERPSLAPYACRSSQSRGRRFFEKESVTRGAFQRDRDRIIHSAAFRRLEYKTQVFVNHEGDFFRTRLTHSLEVAQIARSVCRCLGLNEDLGEALALAHDLGHPPFGHAGEDALKEMLEPYGGFDHNAQSLRVVTQLEARYAEFDGLNLTWETLEGIVKHNGPLITKNRNLSDLPAVIQTYDDIHDLELDTFASAEAQVAAISDDIAYNNHDIDDGLRAGLFTIDDLIDVPLAGPIFFQVSKDYPELDTSRTIHEAIRRMIGSMVNDLISETTLRLSKLKLKGSDDVRAMKFPVAEFSESMRQNDVFLKNFLFENMYKHYKLNRMTSKARRVIKDLFRLLLNEPECLPTDWRKLVGEARSEKTAEIVADFIAGMTDRYALDEHKKLFDVQARTS